MRLDVDAKIDFPRDMVFRAYRDKLPALVPYLPNVKTIEVVERKDEGRKSSLKNLWSAKAEIPKVAQGVIKPEMLSWWDIAVWDEETFSNRWHLEMRAMKDVVRCSGENSFESTGPQTTVLHLRGELTLDLRDVPGVPRFLAGSIAPAVERFVVAMLKPNLLEVSKGLEQYLKTNPG